MDALMRTNFPAHERRVLDCILRKTYGWNKKADRISYSQFQEATGIDRRHIGRSLASLKRRNVIICIGQGYALEYGLQKDYELWDKFDTISGNEFDTKRGNDLTPSQATNAKEICHHPGSELTPSQDNLTPSQATNLTPSQAHTKAIKHNKSIIQKHIYGEFQNVLLTDRDYELLVTRFTEPIAKQWIETLSSSMAANPKKYHYDNHRAAILNWERMDKKREGQNGRKTGKPATEYEGLPDGVIPGSLEASKYAKF